MHSGWKFQIKELPFWYENELSKNPADFVENIFFSEFHTRIIGILNIFLKKHSVYLIS